MDSKVGFVFCVLISLAVAQNVPWRSKIRASPPRPSAPTNKPVQIADSDKCGGRSLGLKGGDHGVITSPGYPNSYRAGLDCEWIIEGEPDSTIQATLFDIRTQNAVFSDISDSLYVSLNGNWSNSQRFSGDLNAITPLIVISDGNRLFLRFRSSSFSTGNRGFRLAYYVTSTGKPALTEIGHDTYTVVSCTYVPVDHPMVFPDEGHSKLKDLNRENLNPFLVALILDDRQFCSGTLVSDRHVITSAHCTKGAQRIDMIFGTSDLLVQDAGVQRRTVNSSSVKEHPYFDTFTGGNDISVVQLNEPVVLNDFVAPAALPSWAYIGATLSGFKAEITGWGDAKSNGNIFSQSSTQTTRISSTAACRATNRGSTGSSMCSQGNSTSSCQTDSGSPIVTRGNICGGQINQGGEGNANAAAQHPSKPNKPGKPSKPSKPGKPGRPHLRAADENEEPKPRPATLLLGVISHGSCDKGFSATRITAYLDFLTEAIGPLERQTAN